MIYENQSLRVRLKVDDQDLSNYKTLKILYRRDDGTEGEWVASIYSADNKYIYYDVPENELVAGQYKIKSWVEFNNDDVFEGKTVYFTVHSRWE